MKKCIDCAHFRAPSNGLSVAEYGKCVAPKIMTISPVTGEPTAKYAADFAVSLRRGAPTTDTTKPYNDAHWCGMHAAWFEPKDAQQPAPAESCSEVGHE